MDRQPVDVEAYIRRSRQGPCFICELVAGNPQYHHHVALPQGKGEAVWTPLLAVVPA